MLLPLNMERKSHRRVLWTLFSFTLGDTARLNEGHSVSKNMSMASIRPGWLVSKRCASRFKIGDY